MVEEDEQGWPLLPRGGDGLVERRAGTGAADRRRQAEIRPLLEALRPEVYVRSRPECPGSQAGVVLPRRDIDRRRCLVLGAGVRTKGSPAVWIPWAGTRDPRGGSNSVGCEHPGDLQRHANQTHPCRPKLIQPPIAIRLAAGAGAPLRPPPGGAVPRIGVPSVAPEVERLEKRVESRNSVVSRSRNSGGF